MINFREKLIGALRTAIGQPHADHTVETLDSVQSLADQVNSLTGRPDAADTFLASQTKLKIKQLKTENTRGMYDKWISQIEATGLSAKDSNAVLKDEVLRLQCEKLGHPAAAPAASTPATPPYVPTTRTHVASFTPPPTATAPGIKWDAKMLSALFDAVAGTGEAERATFRPVSVDLVKRAKAFSVVAPGNPLQAADVALTLAREQQADEAAQAPAREKEDCKRLKLRLLGLGIKLPGLSYNGIPRPGSDAMVLDQKTRELAQRHADIFMATLNGDPDAGCSDSPAAETARGLIRATNGNFTIGATLHTKSL